MVNKGKIDPFWLFLIFLTTQSCPCCTCRRPLLFESFHNSPGLILLFHIHWEKQWGGSNSVKASGAHRGNSVSNDTSKKPGVSLLPP